MSNTGSFLPSITPQFPSSAYWLSGTSVSSGDDLSNAMASGQAGGNYASYSNWLSFPFSVAPLNTFTSSYGRALGVRAEYALGPLLNGYPNAPWSIPPTMPVIKNQTWNYSNMTTQGYTMGSPYAMSYGNVMNDGMFNSPPNATCGVNGYVKPIAA